MTKYILLIVMLVWEVLLFPSTARPQMSNVPNEMQFADIHLFIDQEAREFIQSRVDDFVQMGYYEHCVMRAKLYFPLIEQTLIDERVPADLKYLSLQSSLIIPNMRYMDGSVGLWQMSDSLARQLGLTVNTEIDERMHVMLSSKGIAKHLSEQNYLMRNWLYTLMSYRMDMVDAVKQIDKSLIGANEITITAKSPKAILNLLAYIVAYKDRIEASPAHPLVLLPYYTKNKSLEEIASTTKLPVEQLQNFNKWLLVGKVPSNKQFPVLLPVPVQRKAEFSDFIKKEELALNETLADTTKYPIVLDKTVKKYRDRNYIFAKANGLKAMIATEGDRTADMADAADISPEKFRQLNDMSDFDDVKANQVYYLEKKHKKTDAKEHVLETGESFWDVSQRYGLRLSTLVSNNRLTEKDTAKIGRVVMLNTKRPENMPVQYRTLPANPIYIQPDSETSSVPVVTNNNMPPANTNNKSKDTDSTYTVKANETILDVYRKTNVAFDDLVKINDLKTPNVYEGQVLRLKPSANKPLVNTNSSTNIDPNMIPSAEEVANPNMTVTTADDSIGKKAVEIPELHTVVKGETLGAISKKYNIPVGSLKKWNGLDEKASIRVGQKLKLQAPSATSITNLAVQEVKTKVDTADVVHTVAAKETLYNIEKKYNVKKEDIKEINNLDDKYTIKTGQRLTIRRRTAPRTPTPDNNEQQVQQNQQITTNPVNQTGTQYTGTQTNNTVNQTQQTNTQTGTAMPNQGTAYVVNPPSSGDDIIEVNPSVDHFMGIKKRHYLDNEDIAKWNGIPLNDVLDGSIPPDRRTLVVTQKGYEASLVSGNPVLYMKHEDPLSSETNTQPTNNINPTNTNPAGGNQPPQTGSPQGTQGGIQQSGGAIQKISINAFTDTFANIKQKYNLTDDDLIRLNPSMADAIRGGSIPMDATELVVAGSGGGAGVTSNPPVTDNGTGAVGVNPTTGTGTTPTSKGNAIIHTVNYGETIYGIAQKYTPKGGSAVATIDSINKWNNLVPDAKIDKEQQLVVGYSPETTPVITNPPPANPTSGGGDNPPKQATYHILQKGESLYGLSQKYNVPLKDLIDMNPKVFKDGMVRNGDTVFLQRPAPPKMASPQDEGYYTVQAGDDMYKICEQFKIKPSDLKIWNKLGAGVGVTKPIPAGTKLVVDADLAEALKNPKSDAPATNMTDEPIYHFVKKGETLSAIAKRYNTSVESIKEFNNKEDGNVKEGEQLLVGKIYYHTVEKGETLSSIAQKYKITNEQLKTLNNMKKDVVKEGEKLIVGK